MNIGVLIMKHIQFRSTCWTLLLIFSLSTITHAGVISSQLKSVLDEAAPNDEISVIVELNGKVNRKKYKKLKKKLRRLKLLKELKAKAAENESTLKEYLLGSDSKSMKNLWIINGFSINAKPLAIKKLAKKKIVKEIRLNKAIPLATSSASITSTTLWNLTMVGADNVWTQGHTGQGVVIASMDSGVDYLHEQLNGSWRGGTNSWFDPHGEHILPYDANGHGTQTMGIMASQNINGTTIGMAPSAQWIAVKIFNDAGEALASDIHQGFQWLIDPDSNTNTDDAPDIVNNSWGFPETENMCDTEFQVDIQTLRDMEISVVFSAGNQGAGPSSISPANNDGVFSVGEVDENSIITSTSSHGPSSCMPSTVYPSVTSPGYLVNTTDLTFGGIFANSTTLANGTSFAAPHASGAIALLLSAHPELTVTELEAAIQQSSMDLGEAGDDNVYGSGLINVASALNVIGQPGECTDSDNDGYFAESTCSQPVDCDDSASEIFPGAQEVILDGIDQNCDGYDLTITVTKALYKSARDKLIVYATSSYGSNAGLRVDIPGVGIKTMTWKATKNRWQKSISKISTKGFQADADTTITVFGAEGDRGRIITLK